MTNQCGGSNDQEEEYGGRNENGSRGFHLGFRPGARQSCLMISHHYFNAVSCVFVDSFLRGCVARFDLVGHVEGLKSEGRGAKA